MKPYRLDKPIRGVFAEDGNEYWCVVTIGRGDLPLVSVQGRGLDARVKVGGQPAPFDGENAWGGR